MYQVLSFIGLLGIVINGITAAIFDRDAFEGATWNGDVAGYLVGYTLCLFLFYSLVPSSCACPAPASTTSRSSPPTFGASSSASRSLAARFTSCTPLPLS